MLEAVPLTVIVIGAPSGYATVPKLHVIVPETTPPQLPAVVVADAPVSDAGSVSTTETPAPDDKPRFRIWIV